jgi:hypothetical protein
MRFDGKSTPLMVILMGGHISLVLISPPGELTSMVCFMFAIGRLYFATKLDVMNQCDALESNTTSCACQALSLVIWFSLPYMKFCCPCGLF